MPRRKVTPAQLTNLENLQTLLQKNLDQQAKLRAQLQQLPEGSIPAELMIALEFSLPHHLEADTPDLEDFLEARYTPVQNRWIIQGDITPVLCPGGDNKQAEQMVQDYLNLHDPELLSQRVWFLSSPSLFQAHSMEKQHGLELLQVIQHLAMTDDASWAYE